MIPFNPKPNGMLRHTAVLMIILCISQNCWGLLEDPTRERSRERQSLADDKVGRESSKSSPYIRDVRADSRQSRIDASDIRTDFREIRTELQQELSRDLVRVDARRESRRIDQVLRSRTNQDNTRQGGRVDERSSQNPDVASASRCSRRISFEEAQQRTERQQDTRERRFRSAEERAMKTRSLSRRVLERRGDSSRQTRDVSERSSPNFRRLEERRLLQRDNTETFNVRDHDANLEHRNSNFGERLQKRQFRDRKESRQSLPDFERARRLINQRRAREINLQRARNEESMRFANLQERRFERENRVRDLNGEPRELNTESRESGRTHEIRINSRGRLAKTQRIEPISSPNTERNENRERVAGNIRAQSNRNSQINKPSKDRRVVENEDTNSQSRSNMLVGYNRILPDSFEASKLPARTGQKSDTWLNVAEALLVLALLGQVIGGTSKGKFRCLSWQGLIPKQKVL